MTVGSRSIMTALGTCLPEDVSEKKVLKESSASPKLSSEGIWHTKFHEATWQLWAGQGCQGLPDRSNMYQVLAQI